MVKKTKNQNFLTVSLNQVANMTASQELSEGYFKTQGAALKAFVLSPRETGSSGAFASDVNARPVPKDLN